MSIQAPESCYEAAYHYCIYGDGKTKYSTKKECIINETSKCTQKGGKVIPIGDFRTEEEKEVIKEEYKVPEEKRKREIGKLFIHSLLMYLFRTNHY